MTPIMQKFDDLKCAIARYNRVTAITEKPKILFALGIITFIDEANSVLKAYLKDLERNVCRDALALDFKQVADKGYWLKDDRLRQEMHAYASKPLASYGVTFALDGVTFEDTLQIYRVIEEKIDMMVALLKMVEAALRSASPQLYQNFYQNLRAQYNEEKAENDFDNWLMHSGKMTIGKLKSLQAQAIADYVNSGMLKCAFKTCGDERSHVDIQEIRNLLPDKYPYQEWFDDCYAVFCRTISWDGNIVVPDYYCAGLFIFQHWDQLTEKDIQAIFYLDKTLELIHEEMMKLPEPKKTTKELDASTTERFGKNTPLSALFRENFHEKLRTVIESWRPYLVDDDSNVDALALTRFEFDKKQIYSNRVYFDLLDLDVLGALQVSLSLLARYLADHSNLSSSYETLYRQLKKYRQERP